MKTIIAAFGVRDAAAQAMTDVRNHPYHPRSLWMVDDPRDSAKLMREFEQRAVPREWADLYTEANRRGATIVVGESEDREAEEIAALLEQHGTLNLERSAARWKGDEAWGGYRADQPVLDDTRLAAERQRLESESIPVVEEKVHVGKRETPGETVRVRTFVTERPVHEEVKLREEHVDVSRAPADERISPAAAEQQFQEGEYVVTPTSEVPVVEKEARVVERVKVEKQADTRTETVEETERRREVETERIPPDRPESPRR
jgi:stress response protein YsnF